MAKKDKIKKIRWQPELATSIIYWSITFSAFFLSIISLLEMNGFHVFFLLFLSVFIALTYLGQRRYFQIEKESLLIVAILKKNSYVLPLSDIEQVKIGAYGLTFFGEQLPIDREEQRSFIMTRKSKALFIEELETTKLFTGEIISIEKSVG